MAEVDLAGLIRHLKVLDQTHPGSKVRIATSSQVLHNRVPGLNGARRLALADDSRLGDDGGAVESLFLVTVSHQEEGDATEEG